DLEVTRPPRMTVPNVSQLSSPIANAASAKPGPRRTNDERITELTVERDANTYRVVHTRAAGH
ncbi:hypothetical protein ACWDSD_43800, partial [Streptomyces spiralis]